MLKIAVRIRCCAAAACGAILSIVATVEESTAGSCPGTIIMHNHYSGLIMSSTKARHGSDTMPKQNSG